MGTEMQSRKTLRSHLDRITIFVALSLKTISFLLKTYSCRRGLRLFKSSYNFDNTERP